MEYVISGAERDRTADLLVANEALSQLSYSPTPQTEGAHKRPHPHPATKVSLAGDWAWLQAGIASSSALWRGQAHLGHDPLQILPSLTLLARVAEEKCRMVGDGDLGSSRSVPLATQRGE